MKRKLLIYLLRFGVILLGTILVSLLLFIAAAYSSRSKVFSASTWTPEVIRSIMIVAATFGAGIAAVDSMMFNPLTGTMIIPSAGIMLAGDVEFGLYWDVTGAERATTVEWGAVMPGDIVTVQLWLRNEGDSVLYCDIGTQEWVPSGSGQYFDLTWDFGSIPVNQGRSRKITMELYVHEDITGVDEFAFDIIIYGAITPFTS